ncbi:MAG: porin family protein [Bacteroidota bacterium]
MKKIISAVVLSVILVLPVKVCSQIDIGIKGGYGYNRYFIQKEITQGFLPVYNGGILFQYLNDKKLGVQSSVEFTQKGWDEITVEQGHAKFKMDFVQFEFLSLFKFSSKKENGLFLKFGPYFGYSFNSEYTESGNMDTLTLNYDYLLTHYNKIDYGLRLGISYKFILKNGSLQLELLYAQGLLNILERDPAGIIQSINQSLFINLAYTFTFGRKENKKKKAPLPE